MADKVIDTSKLNVHELRQQLRELVSGRKQASKLVLDDPQLRVPEWPAR